MSVRVWLAETPEVGRLASRRVRINRIERILNGKVIFGDKWTSSWEGRGIISVMDHNIGEYHRNQPDESVWERGKSD